MYVDGDLLFGVNFADGRIKCYPTQSGPNAKRYFLRLVRGGGTYGENIQPSAFR